MKIETDRAQVLSGIRFGKTIGSPIALLIENKDWENWEDVMSCELRVQELKLMIFVPQTPNSKLQTLPLPARGPGMLTLPAQLNMTRMI